MSTCTRCPSDAVVHTLAGEWLCEPCALAALAAVTVTLPSGEPAVDGELPLAPRRSQRATTDRVARRRATRGRADRAALTRLKLAHLPEYNALLADELAQAGRVPTKPRPLDVYLRLLCSKRLAALARRMELDG